jgi:NTE family protein
VLGQPTPFDQVRRIIVFVVNSRSSPKTNWDEVERAPGNVDLLIKATGVPIDHHSYEAVEQLRDTTARWQSMRRIRDSAALPGRHDPELAELARAPNIELYVIDVSFAALQDKADFEYLNSLPTSFVLPSDAVDRLRAAAGTIIWASPDFQRLLKGAGATLAVDPAPSGSQAKPN